MKCPCGYDFALNAVAEKREFRSFAVINDKDYRKVLDSEIKIYATSATAFKLEMIAQATKLVGWLLECPKCKRVLLQIPGNSVDDGPVVYERKGNSNEV